MHSDVCEVGDLVCKEIGVPFSSFFMNPKMAKDNALYRKPGVSCKCKTLNLQQPRQGPYCRVRQTRDTGGDFHWSVHADLYTLVYLIPFS